MSDSKGENPEKKAAAFRDHVLETCPEILRLRHRLLTGPITPHTRRAGGKNHLKEEITPLLPSPLNRLAESIPWNRFLGSINVYKYGL
jgi:hypothetical protein